MLTLLSPAKKLNMNPAETGLSPTRPVLETDTRELAQVAKNQSADDLKRLMHISDKLAELNAERFKSFNLDGLSNSSKQAALSFDGDVYWGLDAKTLSDDDLAYAQDHMRILSGLYGVLRPLDAIQPYRLEMGTKLKTARGGSLYDFWGTIITDQLNKDLEAQKSSVVMNLASNEYFKSVDRKALNADVYEAKFLNIKDGKARNLMYYAKFGRGLMARWITQNRVDKAEELKGFDLEDYRFDKDLSEGHNLVFTRQQPPPKK